MCETAVEAGVVRFSAPGNRWLHAGHDGGDGGFERADAAYNVSVPTGFDRTDLATYVAERRERAGFETPGPAMLTGVDARHARGARRGSVVAVATAGVSNPAALPATEADGSAFAAAETDRSALADAPETHDDAPVGTVNLIVQTDRPLSDGTLASLQGVVVEAKTATLLARTGFPGTTTDAVVVGCDPDGDPAAFAGSGTAVGAAARACVREAVTASLDARYAGTDLPSSVADAEHGVATTETATVFRP